MKDKSLPPSSLPIPFPFFSSSCSVPFLPSLPLPSPRNHDAPPECPFRILWRVHHSFLPLLGKMAADHAEQTSPLGIAHRLRALSHPKLCPLPRGSPHLMAGHWAESEVCLLAKIQNNSAKPGQLQSFSQGHPNLLSHSSSSFAHCCLLTS